MELKWDPEIDTPATIAIIGGGPAGVEAALYGRFLGYTILLYDSCKIGDELIGWGDRVLSQQWSDVTSRLGLAALQAQGTEPLDESLPVTCRSYVEQYLLPLARTDLLHDSIQIFSPVQSISRLGCFPSAILDLEQRSEQEFRVHAKSRQREFSQLVDIVIDCQDQQPRRYGLASGGGFAIGEMSLSESITYGKVDIAEKKRSQYENRHIILFGNNEEACGNAVDAWRLIDQTEKTKLTWLIPNTIENELDFNLPLENLPTWLQEEVKALLNCRSPRAVPISIWGVESISKTETAWKLNLQITEDETLDVTSDCFLHCAGRREPGLSCGLQTSNPTSGLTNEPHYYALNANSNRSDPASFHGSLDQIRFLFSLIGGRENLNLYESIQF